MTTKRDLDALLTDYLADGMTVLPDRVADAVVGEAQRTRQRTMVGRWRTASVFRVALSAAAVVAFLVVGIALLGQRSRNDVVSPPTSSPASSANPTQPVAVPVSPTPTAAVAPSSAPTNEALDLDLTWQEVDVADAEHIAWVGNQFVLRHADGTISASSDGANWRDLQPGSDPGYGELLRDRFAVWQDHVVGWWNPKDPWRLGEFANPHPVMAGDIVSVLQPPAARSESTPFTGRIETMGVGPAGIVAQVKAPRDDRPGYGWYSADGTHWTEVQFDRDYADRPQTLPRSFGQVVGVSDGFIARDFDGDQSECPDLQYGCSTMWHSSDGLTWTKLGIVDSVDGSLLLLPWNGGALLTDGISRFDLWTSEGSSELSLADEVPAPAEFFRANVGTGPLGLVTMLYGGDHPEALITRDGVSWKVQPAPSVPASFASMAVGESSVLYLGWTGDVYEGDILVPHLWVGTANP